MENPGGAKPLWVVLLLILGMTALLAGAAHASPGITSSLITEPLAGIAYTPECLAECHLPLRLVFDESYPVVTASDFAANLTEGIGRLSASTVFSSAYGFSPFYYVTLVISVVTILVIWLRQRSVRRIK